MGIQFISHRINELSSLAKLPEGLGAEIDLRANATEIYMHHDPFQTGEKFKDFLKQWVKKKRGTLILNTKEDGLETQLIELMQEYKVSDYFFLDLALPTSVRLSIRENFTKQAIRFSEYEPIEFANCFRGKADWIWLDCFSGKAPPSTLVENLSADFKICIVSPELQKYPKETIQEFLHLKKFTSAICTKYIDAWAD